MSERMTEEEVGNIEREWKLERPFFSRGRTCYEQARSALARTTREIHRCWEREKELDDECNSWFILMLVLSDIMAGEEVTRMGPVTAKRRRLYQMIHEGWAEVNDDVLATGNSAVR